MSLTLIHLSLVSRGPAENTVSSGLQIAFLGITAVFAGLMLLAVLLPLIRKTAESGGKKAKPSATAVRNLTPEETAAVSVAIHAHLCRLDQEQETKLTWQDHDKPYSPWRLAGRAKLLLSRTGLRLRDRRV
jgi:Na+-transporting methylmalonyl-CoA/oxaloacetate decarboxylase gamma subunit